MPPPPFQYSGDGKGGIREFVFFFSRMSVQPFVRLSVLLHFNLPTQTRFHGPINGPTNEQTDEPILRTIESHTCRSKTKISMMFGFFSYALKHLWWCWVCKLVVFQGGLGDKSLIFEPVMISHTYRTVFVIQWYKEICSDFA